ncbi:MAG: tetratricopeptide repeat protein [Myxococcota bacterium]
MQLVHSSSFDPDSGNRRRSRQSGVVFAALGMALLLLSGCATTTYSTDETPVVTQAVAKRDLGMDYLSSFRTAMAIRELTASLEFDDKDPQTHLWLGEAYRRKGQTEKSEKFLNDSVALAIEQKDITTEQQARLNLSAMLSQMGRYADSLPHCEHLAVDATYSSPWLPLTNCGWALMQLGRDDEARGKFKEALDYFPRYSPALLNQGILEAKQGHRMAALKAFQSALEARRLQRSGRAEANFRMGEIYVALGSRELAIKHFRASVEDAPDIDWGTQSQAYLNLIGR